MMKNIILAFLVIIRSSVTAQITNKIVSVGKNYGKITVQEYNSTYSPTALNTAKYFDLSKPIVIKIGNSKSIVEVSLLRKEDFYPFDKIYSFYDMPFKKILGLHMDGDRLKISSEINAFNETNIAVIKNNRIIKHRASDCNFYITDSCMEIIDEYAIPVLQMKFVKRENTIVVSVRLISIMHMLW